MPLTAKNTKKNRFYLQMVVTAMKLNQPMHSKIRPKIGLAEAILAFEGLRR